jgi:hypothetical protein
LKRTGCFTARQLRRAHRGFSCGFTRLSGVRVRKRRRRRSVRKADTAATERTANTVAERHRVVISDAPQRLSPRSWQALRPATWLQQSPRFGDSSSQALASSALTAPRLPETYGVKRRRRPNLSSNSRSLMSSLGTERDRRISLREACSHCLLVFRAGHQLAQ